MHAKLYYQFLVCLSAKWNILFTYCGVFCGVVCQTYVVYSVLSLQFVVNICHLVYSEAEFIILCHIS
jgi:hypothetical protein